MFIVLRLRIVLMLNIEIYNMNFIETSVQNENSVTSNLLCKCENDACTTVKADELNLPIVNRSLIVPEFFAYYNYMPMVPMYAGYEMCYQGLPGLNQMATSHNTEEMNSAAKR